jgi:hypothetical protein
MRLAYRRATWARLMASTCYRTGAGRIEQAEASLPFLIQVLQSLVVLTLAPLYAGAITRTEAVVQSKRGPSVVQPYRDPVAPGSPATEDQSWKPVGSCRPMLACSNIPQPSSPPSRARTR